MKLALLFLYCAQSALAQITISGTMRLPDDSTPTLAHVAIEPIASMQTEPTSTVVSNGAYRLSVATPGFYAMLFAAPNCQPIRVPILLTENDKSARLDVKLTPLLLKPELDKVAIKLGGGRGELKPMTREADGTFSFVATATADTLAYQIVEANRRARSHNGSQSDYFVYDGGGNYYSVLRTKAGERIKIVFDPNKFWRAPEIALARVQFDAPRAYLEKIFVISKRVETERDKAITVFVAEREKNPGASSIDYDYKPIVAELDAIKNNPSERLEVRQFAALMRYALLSFFDKVKRADGEDLLQFIPPSSAIWGAYPNLSNIIGFRLDDEGRAKAIQLLTAFKEKNPDRAVRCEALIGLGLYAQQSGDKEKLRAIYNELKAQYADLRAAQFGIMEYNPDKAIQVGNPVPDFEVTLLTGEKVSRASMLGRCYLMDFWAVWCLPCVAEMPKLHEAYEKFKGKRGFEILSLSFDQSPETVEQFRAMRFKMPWMHAFLAGAFNHELSKRFEVTSIPKPILVDEKGNIVAVENELRGERLEQTLAKHLSEATR